MRRSQLVGRGNILTNSKIVTVVMTISVAGGFHSLKVVDPISFRNLIEPAKK